MKCLMRMFAEEDKGVIFYETVISLKWQKHTVIECVPLPWDHYEDIPQYFKVCTPSRSELLTHRERRNPSWPRRRSGRSTKR